MVSELLLDGISTITTMFITFGFVSTSILNKEYSVKQQKFNLFLFSFDIVLIIHGLLFVFALCIVRVCSSETKLFKLQKLIIRSEVERFVYFYAYLEDRNVQQNIAAFVGHILTISDLFTKHNKAIAQI